MSTPRERREELAQVKKGLRPKAAIMERAKQDTEAALVEALVDLRDVLMVGCQMGVEYLDVCKEYFARIEAFATQGREPV